MKDSYTPEQIDEKVNGVRRAMGELDGLLQVECTASHYRDEAEQARIAKNKLENEIWDIGKEIAKATVPDYCEGLCYDVSLRGIVKRVKALVAERDESRRQFERVRGLVQVAVGENPGDELLKYVGELKAQLERDRAAVSGPENGGEV
jgi:hypothetical protein